jgi:hypothetical protein
MASVREPDPMASYLMAQQARVLECLMSFAGGEAPSALCTVRAIIRALGDAEAEVLYPAFSRIQRPPEIEYLLTDSRDSRARQLEALETVARRRGPRLRKLAAVELADQLRRQFEQQVSELIPVLASRLPRPLYRSIASAFVARCQLALAGGVHDRRSPRRAPSRVG